MTYILHYFKSVLVGSNYTWRNGRIWPWKQNGWHVWTSIHLQITPRSVHVILWSLLTTLCIFVSWLCKVYYHCIALLQLCFVSQLINGYVVKKRVDTVYRCH